MEPPNTHTQPSVGRGRGLGGPGDSWVPGSTRAWCSCLWGFRLMLRPWSGARGRVKAWGVARKQHFRLCSFFFLSQVIGRESH